MKYLSVTQTAEKWGISTRRIQILCNGNRIPGAIKIGNQLSKAIYSRSFTKEANSPLQQRASQSMPIKS